MPDYGPVFDGEGPLAQLSSTKRAPYGGGGGLTGFTASLDTVAPNDAVNASVLEASGGTTDQDAVFSPKGAGAIVARVPDGTGVGGDKRGDNAVDLQNAVTDESTSGMVASGSRAVISGGLKNTASGGLSTVGGGSGNTAGGGHSVVAGGDSNTAGGISVVSGGENNTASGDHSVVGGGIGNAATDTYTAVGGGAANRSIARSATVGGGESNHADAYTSTVGGGISNTASGEGATVSGGEANTADGNLSWVPGGSSASAHGIIGIGAVAAGCFNMLGDAQLSVLPVRVQTTDGTQATLTSTGDNAPSAINQIALPDHSTFGFHGWVLAREGATGDSSYWTFSGAIKRTGASTVLIGIPTVTMIAQNAGAAAWAAIVDVDNVNSALGLFVTGEAAKTINWIGRIETEELVF